MPISFAWKCVLCNARFDTPHHDPVPDCPTMGCPSGVRRDYSSVRVNRRFINK